MIILCDIYQISLSLGYIVINKRNKERVRIIPIDLQDSQTSNELQRFFGILLKAKFLQEKILQERERRSEKLCLRMKAYESLYRAGLQTIIQTGFITARKAEHVADKGKLLHL